MKKILYFLFILFLIKSAGGQTSEWVIYNSENSDLPVDQIHDIAIDSDNNKWIGTVRGWRALTVRPGQSLIL